MFYNCFSRQNIALNCEWRIMEDNVLFSSRHELTYSPDTRNDVILFTKISDEGNARYNNHNYTAHVLVSHKVRVSTYCSTSTCCKHDVTQ